MKITKAMLDQQVVSEGHNKFSAYASDLGLRPESDWPREIATDLGNGRKFVAQHREELQGDLVAVWYFQGDLSGSSLTLIND